MAGNTDFSVIAQLRLADDLRSYGWSTRAGEVIESIRKHGTFEGAMTAYYAEMRGGMVRQLNGLNAAGLIVVGSPNDIDDAAAEFANLALSAFFTSWEDEADKSDHTMLDIEVQPAVAIAPSPVSVRRIVGGYLGDASNVACTLAIFVPPTNFTQACTEIATEIFDASRVFAVFRERMSEGCVDTSTLMLCELAKGMLLINWHDSNESNQHLVSDRHARR